MSVGVRRQRARRLLRTRRSTARRAESTGQRRRRRRPRRVASACYWPVADARKAFFGWAQRPVRRRCRRCCRRARNGWGRASRRRRRGLLRKHVGGDPRAEGRHFIRRSQSRARARRERELRRPVQGDAEGLGGRRRDQQLGLVAVLLRRERARDFSILFDCGNPSWNPRSYVTKDAAATRGSNTTSFSPHKPQKPDERGSTRSVQAPSARFLSEAAVTCLTNQTSAAKNRTRGRARRIAAEGQLPWLLLARHAPLHSCLFCCYR